jgi:hypothetical protein
MSWGFKLLGVNSFSYIYILDQALVRLLGVQRELKPIATIIFIFTFL